MIPMLTAIYAILWCMGVPQPHPVREVCNIYGGYDKPTFRTAEDCDARLQDVRRNIRTSYPDATASCVVKDVPTWEPVN